MATAAEESMRFVPSHVDGLPSVTEAGIYPDRLELLSEDRLVVVRFAEIARWHPHRWLENLLATFGFRMGNPYVGDRDWFHPPARRFFRFFTTPPITVYMPNESSDLDYAQTTFRRVQDILWAGGYLTFDLG